LAGQLPLLPEPEETRMAFGCFPTGVAVATTLDSQGRRVGMTISSFNSVSLDPPLVLWSIANDSLSYDAFANAEHFAVNVLKEGLKGIPILPEFAACFECSTEHHYPGGDHLIIVGRVHRFQDRELDPLIFYRSQFLGKGEPRS
jgi:3-hydroxy-9,10-secoandrosta-1,3,5(10)-triene-9,17-dione monooxygenase reductase component